MNTIKLSIVLNLVINGLPSILKGVMWRVGLALVLNLVINGLPSIQKKNKDAGVFDLGVLNLVINGLPSIHTNKNIEC